MALHLAGIDVSKDRLDIALRGHAGTAVFDNTASGWEALGAWLHEQGVGRVALEATGTYHRGVMRSLQEIGLDVLQLQPKQVQAYAKMRLQHAKTDRLDAKLIADCAVMLEQHARRPLPRRFDKLGEWLTYVDQLVDDQAQQKTRLEHVQDSRIRSQIQTSIRHLAARVAAVRKQLEGMVRRHADLATRLDMLQSIPAIGPVTALVLVVRMPELGTISRGAAASLAGLAPFVHQSGRWKGQTHIGGGRAAVRRALYMAAMVGAYRYHPALKAMRERLIGRGKAPLCALIACARKLLVEANAVLARGTPWQASRSAAV